MLDTSNLVLLAAEIAVYFSVMALLFRLRHAFGLGIFICALGTMHFLETYLASALYVEVASGIAVSPGSTVLFAGKLILLLIVYIQEDAATVRQPIFGLLIGNFLMVALVLLLRQHEVVSLVAERRPDFRFIDEMGWLMAWGTILLFIDSILIVLIYEKTQGWLGGATTLRIFVSAALVLTFDQIGFFTVLHFLIGMPPSAMLGGWAAKIAAALAFSALAGGYIRWCEPQAVATHRHLRLSELFDVLTYRRRYQALLKEHERDGLTGALTRRRYDLTGPGLLAATLAQGQPFSAIVIDIDHFKSINDRHGHAVGDRVLAHVAAIMLGALRDSDHLYRYGGEEFVVLCGGVAHEPALALAERLRREIAGAEMPEVGRITISAGVATSPDDATDLTALFTSADARLYAAKAEGRDRVRGEGDRSAA